MSKNMLLYNYSSINYDRRDLMTIVDAIVTILNNSEKGMTSKEIYKKIVDKNLYSFGAKDPTSVVNAMIRRRCKGLDFPTAYPIKLFGIVGYKGKKPLFALLESNRNFEESNDTTIVNADLLPEEKIGVAITEHIEAIRSQVFDFVINNSPSFFEHLVIDLLLKMGYGYDKNSGVVTGRSHDGGIDGIISEDKLGLDLIYIQAKRYTGKNTVGRRDVQAFVGAMENVQKGVFITTSKFTKEAIDFINRQQKNIKLIDGKMLADLLVKYQVGINVVQTLSIYKLDSDYYRE